MKSRSLILAVLVASAPAAGASAVVAQDTLQACPTQQGLEQSISSGGSITPDECQSISVNSLMADGRRLCLLDFGSEDGGFLEQLRDAALPSQWWVECELLVSAAQQ